MDNVPNSYEESQELLKQDSPKRRSPFLRTIILSFLSVLIVFIVWTFYPISSPKFVISSILPANTAINFESHNPTDLIEDINTNSYLRNLYNLPLWETLEHQYQKTHQTSLKNDSAKIFDEITSKARKIIGLRNVIAVTGGLSYNQDGFEDYHAVAWLDNIGYMLFKAAEYTHDQEVFSKKTYFRIPLNSRQDLFITQSPAYPRAVLMTTSLEGLNKFRVSPKKQTQTGPNTTENILKANIYLHNLPKNSFSGSDSIQDGEFNITWSTTKTDIEGRVRLLTEVPERYRVLQSGKKLQVNNTKPSLILNVTLPNGVLEESGKTLLHSLQMTTNPLLKPLANTLELPIINEFQNQISLMITEPSTLKPANALLNSRMYFGITDAKNAQASFIKSIKTIAESYSKSPDITLKILSNQLKLETKEHTTLLGAPLLPKISTTFSEVSGNSYAEIKQSKLAEYKPTLSNTIITTPQLSVDWLYSNALETLLNTSVSSTLSSEKIFTIDSFYQISFGDILNFLYSSEFFTLSLKMNNDNKEEFDITVKQQFRN